MTSLNAVLETLADRVEHASALDRPAGLLQKVAGLVPGGRVKDALSGTWLGHPLHPALVAVPVGACVGASLLDATGADPAARRRLVGLGLLASVPAAATGLSDWAETSGAERRVGTLHALSNTVGLALLATSWLRRGRGHDGSVTALAGTAVLGLSGWLGGHLAYAMGVGVDTTAFQQVPQEWTDAVALDDLPATEPLSVVVGGAGVLLVRDGGTVRALSDRCSHRGAPLHEGSVADGCVTCPWHGSLFELADGAVRRGPATRPQPAFETRVQAGRVQVRRREERGLRSDLAP